MTRVEMKPGWEKEVKRVPAVKEATERLAKNIASSAAAAAPKRTGEGAASIHAEDVGDGEWRVSWDPEHDYMRFSEFGTEHEAARPFLRPAAHRHTR